MKRFALVLVLSLGACCSVNKKAINDVAGKGIDYSAQIQAYWDADVAAGKHDAAWATAKKTEMKAWLDALTALQNSVK